MKPVTRFTLHGVLLLTPQQSHSQTLFNYIEMDQSNLQVVEQWTKVRTRHPREDIPTATTGLAAWFDYLKKTARLPAPEQLVAINNFANAHPYIIGMHNYGVDDYWAIIKEFLQNNGDCEDHAIIKFYSLRELGFDNDQPRIVILQDTNLQVAHAVLAVFKDDDIVILDNQVSQILSHYVQKQINPQHNHSHHGHHRHLVHLQIQ